MKKIILFIAVIATVMFTCVSCVTAQAFDTTYHPYDLENNLVVENDICYVYYTNPTTLFLNTLHIIDGAYYYWCVNKYIPVIFPNWSVWSPHRYFYYDRNRWAWRDRYHYNHEEYRRNQHWIDYRKPHHSNVSPSSHKQHPNQHFDNRHQPNVQNRNFDNRHQPNGMHMSPNRNSSSRVNGGGFGSMPSGNRATVNQGGGHRGGGGHFGGGRR